MPLSPSVLADQHANVIQTINQSSNVLADIHSTLQERYHEMQSGYDGLCKQYNSLLEERTEQQAVAEKLKRDRDKLLAERAKREAEDEVRIRAAQEAAFAFNAQMTSAAQPDEEIRKKLTSLQSQWASFAKEWAAKDISKIFIEGDTSFMEIAAQPYISSSERNANDGLFSTAILPSCGRLFLHAELSHFICWNLIKKPFFAFHGIEAAHKTRTDTIDNSALILECIVEEIMNGMTLCTLIPEIS